VTQFVRNAEVGAGVLTINVADRKAAHVVETDCVVDISDAEEAVGLEILGIGPELGRSVTQLSDGGIHWSYDAEVDAVYVRVGVGRSSSQCEARCLVAVDSVGNVVSIGVRMNDPK
jgi:uncharacterized protein YuzE